MPAVPGDYSDRLHHAGLDVIMHGDKVTAAARRHNVAKGDVKAHAWALAKELCRSRDNDQCQRCGRYGTHDVHHRQPRKMGGTSDSSRAYGLGNLLTLCRTCHEYVEAHRAEAIARGYIVPAHADPDSVPLQAEAMPNH